MTTQDLITPDVIASANSSVLCWLATVDASGQPNVSPKEIFHTFDGQHIVIANIASPLSAKNIEASGKACVSFIDVFTQKGYKVSGSASNISRQAPAFAHWSQRLLAMAGSRFPIRSVFVIQATTVSEIMAPSYRFYPNEVTEDAQVASALKTYGVQRLQG